MCMQCGRLSVQCTREWGLVMPVRGAEGPTRGRVTDLYSESCKSKADATEMKCNGACGARTAHRVQARALTTPNVLLVQVRRPGADGTLQKFSVDVEDQLHLPGMDALELAAVVYHDGANVNSGKYMCVCRCSDGAFRMFDGAVQPYPFSPGGSQAKKGAVHMLVYTRPRGGERLCRRLDRSTVPEWKQWGRPWRCGRWSRQQTSWRGRRRTQASGTRSC